MQSVIPVRITQQRCSSNSCKLWWNQSACLSLFPSLSIYYESSTTTFQQTEAFWQY